MSMPLEILLMSKYSGIFVTIDGPNGVGKSTIVICVASRLRQLGFDILETGEPTASDLGKFVRQLEADYCGRVYACLVAADRYYHLECEVIPALQESKVVLSNRYVESSLVLQRLDGVELEFIWALNSQIYIPDLSVILTAPVEVLEQRLSQRASLSRFERTKSRAMELSYYLEAVEFLSKRGFKMLLLDNGNTPLEENVSRLTEEVKNLMRMHNYGNKKS